jgi:hypothetical protein
MENTHKKKNEMKLKDKDLRKIYLILNKKKRTHYEQEGVVVVFVNKTSHQSFAIGCLDLYGRLDLIYETHMIISKLWQEIRMGIRPKKRVVW